MNKVIKTAGMNKTDANQDESILPDAGLGFISPYAEEIFSSLRSIFRATLLHYRELEHRYHLTGPQMVLLRRLSQRGPSSPGELARDVFLSQATVTGILDRLETAGLVDRKRENADRRRVTVYLTEKGDALSRSIPVPLQESFASALSALPLNRQAEINTTLGLIVKMMYAGRESSDLNDVMAEPDLPKD